MVKIEKHDFGDEILYDIVVGLDYELESCSADFFDRTFCDLTEKDLLEIKKELDKLNLT
jgi:hypothetical protein